MQHVIIGKPNGAGEAATAPALLNQAHEVSHFVSLGINDAF